MTICALLAMGFLASLGSYFLKKSTAGRLSIRALLFAPWLYLGVALYVLSALLNLYLLHVLPYSIVVPLGSLTYIWTLLLSRRLLKEPITRQKVTSVGLILLGVALVTIF
ncbi:MAG: EamA family transporter [Clostridiaceae bacterium]|nr:EamA family transporter [Clostridiaceae bacterium]